MNTRTDHERARSLVLDQFASSLESEDAVWLQRHIDDCPNCRAYAESARHAILTLKGVSEMPSLTLVRATQRSVRFASRNLGDSASQRRMLVISCALAAVWGALLQPYLWRLFAWIGASLALPDSAWQAAFLAMWLLPGIVVVLVLTHLPLPSRMRRGIYKGRNQ